MTIASRRAQVAAEIVERTGIDEAMIEDLVHRFYARVREDALLGPVFEERVADWGSHLQRMCSFWSSVALMTGRYHGRPMEKHLPLPVDAEHFDRWLALFEEVAREACPPAARSEEHTSELQSLMRISYAVFCLKKKNTQRKSMYRGENQKSQSLKKQHQQ